jgi:plasmid maintenance system antidote protein VapI
MIKNGMRPVHPGEVLIEEFMKPSEPPINANMLAKAIDVPANRITSITKGSAALRAIPEYVWQHFSTPPLNSG